MDSGPGVKTYRGLFILVETMAADHMVTRPRTEEEKQAIHTAIFQQWGGLLKRLADAPGFEPGDPRNGTPAK